jgi:hypothetical protein
MEDILLTHSSSPLFSVCNRSERTLCRYIDPNNDIFPKNGRKNAVVVCDVGRTPKFQPLKRQQKSESDEGRTQETETLL